MKFLTHLFVGLPIVFVFLVIFAGGLQNACMVLGASVVCTFGLGLLLWVHLCWFVGWLVVKVFNEMTGKENGQFTSK